MNTVEKRPPLPPPSSFAHSDVYDPDDVGARSPLLQPVEPKLIPSPSPEPMVPIPDASPDKGAGLQKERYRPSMGDGVLVHFMANGKYQDLSRQVAKEPLASLDESDLPAPVPQGVSLPGGKERDDAVERGGSAPQGQWSLKEQTGDEKSAADLTALAAKALSRTAQSLIHEDAQLKENHNGALGQARAGEHVGDLKSPMPSILVNSTQPRPTPELSIHQRAQISSTEALAPIQHNIPNPTLPNGSNSVTLPSLTDHLGLGDIKNLPDTPRDVSTFPQSPPAPPPPPRYPGGPGHGSPPKSPIDYRALPSPGRNFFYPPNRRTSQIDGTPYSDGLPYPSPVDYTSSNAETPSDQSTPALAVHRMSIEGITNPPVGGFQCTHAGCTAQPFQTQYLLNSHANVHSQNRPHYCSVKGCPRSEGGKGFKRKNEMIRHGLVHDSPGYVCPFCPDREHKYPRPDNLQRHVRVHHVGKDKDDPLLRDVLAQRPEGPSRGRRRRGTNG